MSKVHRARILPFRAVRTCKSPLNRILVHSVGLSTQVGRGWAVALHHPLFDTASPAAECVERPPFFPVWFPRHTPAMTFYGSSPSHYPSFVSVFFPTYPDPLPPIPRDLAAIDDRVVLHCNPDKLGLQVLLLLLVQASAQCAHL